MNLKKRNINKKKLKVAILLYRTIRYFSNKIFNFIVFLTAILQYYISNYMNLIVKI